MFNSEHKTFLCLGRVSRSTEQNHIVQNMKNGHEDLRFLEFSNGSVGHFRYCDFYSFPCNLELHGFTIYLFLHLSQVTFVLWSVNVSD